ncbi:putative regulator PrlF [compost metagenome]
MGKTAATSKASRKNQTTIPARVRKALQVAKGDTLLWMIDGDQVTVSITKKVKIDWTKTSEMSLLEWNAEEEREAALESEAGTY